MDVMLFLLFFGVMGITGALIAQNKNRSGFAWFFICFLLPIAILPLLVLPAIERGRKCPHCRESIPVNADRCWSCNVILDAPRPAPVAATEKTCPRCAEAVKAAAVVCRFCGHEFETTPQPSPAS